MSHPPIPPKCKYVISNHGKHPMIGLNGSYTFAGEIDKACIAAICRCGWLDEAKRLNALRYEQRNLPVSGRPNYTSPMLDAYENAEAWRLWETNK